MSVIAVLTIPLSFAHTLYACFGGLYLLEWARGMEHLPDGWTVYQRIDVAWAIPIHVPGTAILAIVRRPCVTSILVCHDLRIVMDGIGKWMILLGSIATGYSVASLSTNLIFRRSIDFGWKWKLLLALSGVIWIPVPIDFALVYYITVLY